MSDDDVFHEIVRSAEQEALVQAMAERLALALRATAAHYRRCAPEIPSVLETLGEYVVNPEKAEGRLKQEEESLRRLGLIR